MSDYDYKAVDAVVNIWNEEALRQRPGWGDEFFQKKMKSKESTGNSLEIDDLIETLDDAGIDKAFLIAAYSGRIGLPGCYHMPYEIVARACEKYPDRLFGLAGVDPYEGMKGVKAFEDAITNMGFIGAHFYPHWFELQPDHRKVYPIYAKCWELGVPIQMQVGQSMIYNPDFPCISPAKPITLDPVACDFPELKLIGIHVGIPWVEEMIAMAWKHKNVYIGCDAHRPKYWPKEFTHYINSFGQDKVIFGTDFPVLPFKRTVEDIDNLGLKPEARRKLMRDNALRIYGLEGK